jgi:hypothetical protein
MEAESRELIVGMDGDLGAGAGLEKDSDAMEGQGIMEDATFHDSDRGRG